MMWNDRIKTTWNDGPPFESILDDPWAPHPVAKRNICNDGGGARPQSQQSFTTQQQEQRSRSESQPNSFVQGFLKGITGNMYDMYTRMPGGNPVPNASADTQGFWQGARNFGGTGMAGGAVNAARDNLVTSTLRGDYLNLANNPYFQGALGALRQPTENFLNNVVPGLKSTFASAGRAGSGENAEGKMLQQAIDTFGRTTNEAAERMGNATYQFERGQQASMASLLPSLQGMDLARLGLLGQAGQAQDAYNLQKAMGPMDFATRAAMGILGAYPGGATDSNGWSTGSGSTVGTASGGGGGAASWLGPAASIAGSAAMIL